MGSGKSNSFPVTAMIPRRPEICILCAIVFILVVITLYDNLKENDDWSPHKGAKHRSNSGGRTIYVVTPTYPRSNQLPEMTQLAQTLMLVPDVHWVVAEDTHTDNTRLIDYLMSTDIPFTYIRTPMPKELLKWRHPPKGVPNRRAALAWIRKNAKSGVVYFADDDNTYDYRLFEEIRSTRGVSMFPVGFVTRYQLSTPVVKDGKFDSWYDGWIIDRKYPVDMAAFAFSVELLLKRPRANMAWSYDYQEESILASLGVLPEDIEFKADDCTKIWVWHTKSIKPEPASRDICHPRYDGTNLRALEKQMYVEGKGCQPVVPDPRVPDEGKEKKMGNDSSHAMTHEMILEDYEN